MEVRYILLLTMLMLSTTLCQATGNDPRYLGISNVDLRNDPYTVCFGGCSPIKLRKQRPYNITAILENAGCRIFASLIEFSISTTLYENAMDEGLTLFAPVDEAFGASGVPDVNTFDLVQHIVFLHHALPRYTPKSTLRMAAGPVETMADHNLTVTSTSDDDITLHTGEGASSRIVGTVIDKAPVCVFALDNLLLPSDFLGAGLSRSWIINS